MVVDGQEVEIKKVTVKPDGGMMMRGGGMGRGGMRGGRGGGWMGGYGGGGGRRLEKVEQGRRSMWKWKRFGKWTWRCDLDKEI